MVLFLVFEENGLFLEGKESSRNKVFGDFHLLCFCNSKTEMGEKILEMKWSERDSGNPVTEAENFPGLMRNSESKVRMCQIQFSYFLSPSQWRNLFLSQFLCSLNFILSESAMENDPHLWPVVNWLKHELWVRKNWFQFLVLLLCKLPDLGHICTKKMIVPTRVVYFKDKMR